MALKIVAVFEPLVPDSAPRKWEIGAAVLDELTELEELADKFGVVRLSAFGDNRELPADFSGDPEELSRTLGPFSGWFRCDILRQAVPVLLTAFSPTRLSAFLFAPFLSLS
ncbi:MAG: hypothetical protein ACKO3P_04325, partial [Planctomycetaceae bacterium]